MGVRSLQHLLDVPPPVPLPDVAGSHERIVLEDLRSVRYRGEYVRAVAPAKGDGTWVDAPQHRTLFEMLSQPFSRGALLGDRIRLAEHFLDPEVYIRSMGTRGHLGGLAEATLQALLLVDASGRDVVFLETVGTGQSEVEVIGIADVVLLVLMPGSGDAVQALKAGIMEIPDVIVVNKMDHPAAETMLQEVRSIVALDPDRERRPPILLTDALRGEGVPELWHALEERRAALEARGELAERRERNLSGEVETLAVARLRERVREAMAEDAAVVDAVDRVTRRELDPLTAVSLVVGSVTGNEG